MRVPVVSAFAIVLAFPCRRQPGSTASGRIESAARIRERRRRARQRDAARRRAAVRGPADAERHGRDERAARRRSGRTMMALVTGLNDGSNTLVATAGKAISKLTVVNHPNAGPVISGPHEQPFICETEKFKLMSGGVAGKPLDAELLDRNARRLRLQVDGSRAAATGRGRGASRPSSRCPIRRTFPSDVAMTTTSLGAQVPFIVRVETGTINRGVYEIAMLFNPAKDAQPDFMTKPAGWNGRLIYTFGGGCAGGWYKQGTGTGGVDDEVMLQQGYAVASNSLNVMGNDCAELLDHRDDDDDERALHRSVRRAEVHGRLGRIGRDLSAASDRRRLSGPARRPDRAAQLPRHGVRHGRDDQRRTAARELLRQARRIGDVHRRAEAADCRARSARHAQDRTA